MRRDIDDAASRAHRVGDESRSAAPSRPSKGVESIARRFTVYKWREFTATKRVGGVDSCHRRGFNIPW